jgi:hypothetical protein
MGLRGAVSHREVSGKCLIRGGFEVLWGTPDGRAPEAPFLLVHLAQTVLGVCAVSRFLWMLIAKERNPAIAGFGQGGWRTGSRSRLGS